MASINVNPAQPTRSYQIKVPAGSRIEFPIPVLEIHETDPKAERKRSKRRRYRINKAKMDALRLKMIPLLNENAQLQKRLNTLMVEATDRRIKQLEQEIAQTAIVSQKE